MSKSRSGARRLLVQALYQNQLADHNLEQLREQFAEYPNYANADTDYFNTLLEEIDADREALDSVIEEFGQISVEKLDPVEHAVLWVALAELKFHTDVPPKVVISEAIKQAKLFGAEGGHRYVNGLLDKAAAGVLNKSGQS
jgi:N utilization substance protein B